MRHSVAMRVRGECDVRIAEISAKHAFAAVTANRLALPKLAGGKAKLCPISVR